MALLYFLPLVLSSAIVFALLGFVGHWLGGREIARKRHAFLSLVVAGSLVFMPVLAGMIGHPPVPFLVPLIAAVTLLADRSAGLVITPASLVVGFLTGLGVFAMSAYGRANRIYRRYEHRIAA
jgi:hypothetical protein